MRLLLFVILCITTFDQLPKPHTDNKQNAQAKVDKPAVDQQTTDAGKPPAQTQINTNNYENPEGNKTVKDVSDGLLALFTLALVIVSIMQWLVLRGHEEWMRKHDGHLEKLAKAAEDNANAALLNAKAAIFAERPWVSIFGVFAPGRFTFKAANFGNTPAEILSYTANITFVDRVDNLPIPPNYIAWKQPPLTLLAPGRTTDDASLDLMDYDMNNAVPIVDPTKPIFVFYFRILYRNPLSSTDTSITHHESRMCFWSRLGQTPQVGGPQEYNKHT